MQAPGEGASSEKVRETRPPPRPEPPGSATMLDELIITTKTGKTVPTILYARVSTLEELALGAVANKLLLPVPSHDLAQYKKPWGWDGHDPHYPNGCYTMETGGWRDGRRRGRVEHWHACVTQNHAPVGKCPDRHRELCALETKRNFWVSVIDWDGDGKGTIQRTLPADMHMWSTQGPLLLESRGKAPVLRTHALIVPNPSPLGNDAPLLADALYLSRDGTRVALSEPDRSVT